MKKKIFKETIEPVSGTKVPRYAGPSTFARLPELRDVEKCDVAIVGIPFDAGTSFRPGARFGPQSIRQASRHLRTNYHPNYDIEPFKAQQVTDAGDITCNPFNYKFCKSNTSDTNARSCTISSCFTIKLVNDAC